MVEIVYVNERKRWEDDEQLKKVPKKFAEKVEKDENSTEDEEYLNFFDKI